MELCNVPTLSIRGFIPSEGGVVSLNLMHTCLNQSIPSNADEINVQGNKKVTRRQSFRILTSVVSFVRRLPPTENEEKTNPTK